MTNATTSTIVTMEQSEPDGQTYRTVERVSGNVIAAMQVPTVEEANAELQQAWAVFTDALDAVRPVITQPQANDLDNAAVNIEGAMRRLAATYHARAATALLHHDVSTFFVPTPDA
jgi:hypothetical protein